MYYIIQSDEFIEWFAELKHIVETQDLTNDSLDPEDFAEHFMDEYSVMDSISEYFDFNI